MKPRTTRRISIGRIALGAVLAGCTQQPGVVMYGNGKSVAVQYYGDLANATEPARQFCAQYGRNAEYIGTAEHLAQFDCTPR
jgi:hypothetical protein